MFLDDLMAVLVAAGVGTKSVDIFATSASQMPTGIGPYLSLIETGGTAPERTHNTIHPPAYQRPGAQITVRAKSYAAARVMAKNAYDALGGVRNTTISGVWYREISPVQEPFDLGLDENGRARVVFNVYGIKRPS